MATRPYYRREKKQVWTTEQWADFCTLCQRTRTALGDLIRGVERTPWFGSKPRDRADTALKTFVNAMGKLETVVKERVPDLGYQAITFVHGPEGNVETYSRERREYFVPLSREEWVATGCEAKAILDQILTILRGLYSVLPKNHRAVTAFRTAYRMFTYLQMELDSICYRQHPDWEDFTKVFYGPRTPAV